MIKINIIKQNIITNSASFQTQEEANVWLAECEGNESFGKAAYDEVIDDVVIHHESEYVVEQSDITVELQARKESDEAKAYLLATDYKVIKAMETGIPMDEQIKLLRAEARLKVI